MLALALLCFLNVACADHLYINITVGTLLRFFGARELWRVYRRPQLVRTNPRTPQLRPAGYAHLKGPPPLTRARCAATERAATVSGA